MEMNEQDIVKVAKALSNKTRVRILREILRRKSITCHEAEKVDRLSQPTISHHLKVLLEAGLLHAEKDGRFGIITVNREALKSFGGLLSKEMKA
jgi:ArsR family transcriptional regulator